MVAATLLLPRLSAAQGDSPAQADAQRSITDRSIAWPALGQWRRVLLLEDYNTRVVVLGTTLLGCAAGLVGSFTLLRKRALMGDALSHATLPGIGLAFIIASMMGFNGKSLPLLLFGAAASGLIGVASILFIRNLTRLKEDAALGIVLSVFFGAGVAVLGVVQQMQTGHAAGLEAFIYGKTASMGAQDAVLIGSAGLACAIASILLFKELKLLCFDEGFASSRGYPVVFLDITLMALVVIVTIIGLQAVGLILMIALLVIPAAAARFWTEKMYRMSLVSAALGAVSGMIGAVMSGVFAKLPSGAMIVLVSALFFLVSMILGPARGVLIRWLRRYRLNRRIDRQHLLRGVYEHLEARGFGRAEPPQISPPVPLGELLVMRSWSAPRLRREIRRATRESLVRQPDVNHVCLTTAGFKEAARLTFQHRLWELYLITHADIAPSVVDRDADAIEHVLEPEMISELESLLHRRQSIQGVPRSPHEIQVAAAGVPSPARED
ncbi:MAG: metal ABC transporter permease [Planctomycetes bacterium]|nr:metal ABC transporter permease [Planctomycetota bacterium]